jgi:hypothetical protein
MAQVHLSRHEAEGGLLPPVCMVCGAHAEQRKQKRLSWKPSWVIALPVIGLMIALGSIPGMFEVFSLLMLVAGMLGYLVVSALTRQHLMLRAPLCERHTHHWVWQSVVIPVTLLVLVLMCCGGVPLLEFLTRRPGSPPLSAFYGMWVLFLGVVWLASSIVIDHITIHATEITPHGATLDCVSDGFVHALHRYRLTLADLPVERPGTETGSEQIYDPAPEKRIREEPS